MRYCKLTARDDLEPDSLLGQDFEQCRVDERLPGVRNVRLWVRLGERGRVSAADGANGRLVEKVERAIELLDEVGEVAAADGDVAAVVDFGGVRKQLAAA